MRSNKCIKWEIYGRENNARMIVYSALNVHTHKCDGGKQKSCSIDRSEYIMKFDSEMELRRVAR